MFGQISPDIILLLMLYAVGAAMAFIACVYLLFRRGNAFVSDIVTPVRLRRWTAAFFAVFAFCHLWYLPTYFLTSPDGMMLGSLIAGLLDCITVIPLAIIVLFAMLQDRRRPLWPVAVMVAPLVLGMAWRVVNRSDVLLPVLFVYFLLMWLGLIIYMVREVRRYGRWLRDNYADLEHKEVWQSFVVLAIILLVYAIYSLDVGELIYEYALDVIIIVLVCYLLWRVETLSDLSTKFIDDLRIDDLRIDSDSSSNPSDKAIAADNAEVETVTTENMEDSDYPLSIRNSIGSLLQRHCIDKQLYLQHDLTILQLAKIIGTNRLYLSQYFSGQGTTYNAYINDLRINHFISLYHEAVDSQRSTTAQQLALESGYSSYNTFRDAFKRKTGQSVTAWMKGLGNPEVTKSAKM